MSREEEDTVGQLPSRSPTSRTSFKTSLKNLKSFSFTATDRDLEKHADELFYVPKEILPCLERISTQQYVDYIEDRAMNHHNMCVRFAMKAIECYFVQWFMSMVIVLNVVVLIIETDHVASAGDNPQSDMRWVGVVGWLVLGIFVVELIVRMVAFRSYFWKDMANVFDFLIVTLDACFSCLAVLVGTGFPLSVLRIFRLAKLARISKLLFVFPELRLLLAGLIGSISAIFWGTILLCFGLIVWSMMAVIFIHPLNQDIEYEDCERCGRAYSSVAHATLTFWQSIVTGDSWGAATIPIIEKHPTTAIYFVGVYLTIGLAVTQLILGVIVSVAQKTREDLMQEDKTKNTLVKMKKRSRLFHLCKEMDLDKNGLLSKDELISGFTKPGEFREAVLGLNIGDDDLDLVWAILDPDNKGAVSYKELVAQLASLRSSDSQFMLCYIKYYITELRHKLESVMTRYHKETLAHELLVEAEVKEVKEKEDAILEEEKRLEQMTLKVEEELHKIDRTKFSSYIEPSHIEPILAASKSDHFTATTDKISRIRQAARTDSSNARSSTSATSDEQVGKWVQCIRDDIAKVQLELKDLFRLELKEISMAMNSNFGHRLCQVTSLQPQVSERHGALPEATPSCCASQPVRNMLLPKEAKL